MPLNRERIHAERHKVQRPSGHDKSYRKTERGEDHSDHRPFSGEEDTARKQRPEERRVFGHRIGALNPAMLLNPEPSGFAALDEGDTDQQGSENSEPFRTGAADE